MFKFCFSVLTLFLFASPLRAASASVESHLTQHLDALLRTDAPHPFNGTVLITKGKQVLYGKAWGQANRSRKTPLVLDSQFIIGSISKQMTAALVLREADNGRLRLGAPIKTYLPNLSQTWANVVTVEQLLNHTSGIDKLDAPLRSQPGTVFVYTNLEYDLLGSIVEKTSGKSFTANADSMFKTCGMNRTSVPPSGTITALQKLLPHLVSGYTEQSDGTLKTEDSNRDATTNPSGGIISTVGDLQRWNTCLHGGKLLKALTYRAMITPTPSAKRSHRWGVLGYGLGIQVSTREGLLELSHSGYVPGYISTLIYYPQQQVSVVVLENTAWLTSDISRVFSVHDRLREIIRNMIKLQPVGLSR